jgi:hypothetical protein
MSWVFDMLVPYISAIFSRKITVFSYLGMPKSSKMYENPFGACLKQSQTVVAKRIKSTFVMITQLLVEPKQ